MNLSSTTKKSAPRATPATQPQQGKAKGRTGKEMSTEPRDEESVIMTAEDGALFLEKKRLTIAGDPVTTESLTTTLFRITQMQHIPLQVKNAIRSVAFLLEQTDNEDKAKRVAETVKKCLEEQSGDVEEMLEQVKAERAGMEDMRDECARLMVNARNTQDEISETLSDLSTNIDV